MGPPGRQLDPNPAARKCASQMAYLASAVLEVRVPNVVEEIPPELKPAADAALAWINRQRSAQFKLTGLVDPDEALSAEAGQPIELGLVLCEGDVCLREQVRVQAQGESFQVAALEVDEAVIPPHLDPPVGVRESWLDDQLARHAFIVIVFYRGFW